MWLVAAVYAGELPWACPTVTTPEEAEPYDTDAGVDALIDDLETAARGWWEEGCDWEVVEDWDTTTQTCTTSAGAEVTYVSRDWSGEDTAWEYGSEWTLTVTPPSGAETWSSLEVASYEDESGTSAWGTAAWTRSARWSGSVAGAPDDGFAEGAYDRYFNSGYDHRGYQYETPGCAWSWSTQNDGGGSHETRILGDVSVSEEYGWGGSCEWQWAYLNGVLYGAVTADTWALDEADLDGYSVAFGDCDDADPSVHPCADEVAFDGIDQDCDGADSFDADGDGHDAASAGGDDCDDASRAVFPGADDAGGDGIDGDCDGHDDVDADGDGYTADGDNRTADCDDADPAAYPGAEETPGDGVDQDCDGVDPPADDPPAEDTATADLPEPPSLPDPAHRCGGADALLLIPLAGRRRPQKA